MNTDYENALKFWDQAFKDVEPYEVVNKFVDSELFNNIVKEHIHENDEVLDFGSGSGWGLMELALTTKFKNGVGIDTSPTSVKLANEVAKKSNLNNIHFEVGNESNLKPNTYDFILSVNTLDVVPDEITNQMLQTIHESLKDGGYALICLNPLFTHEELVEKLKMEKRGTYYYKNDILRCNYKSIEEWEKLFKQKFNLEISEPFKLMQAEGYYRRLYLLRK